jgi:diaminopimelate epimerase
MTVPLSRTLVKAHAYGNDFLLAPVATLAEVREPAALARMVCERHRGVGADGLMLVEETSDGAVTRLFNADGSRSEVSGNGVRCVGAWLAHMRSLDVGAAVRIETGAGAKHLTLLERIGPACVFRADMGAPTDLREERIVVDGQEITAVVLRVGNPQCVVLGPVTEARLRGLAGRLAVHPFFPEGTNVELATVESPGRVRILIWERGVGPTEASGTGACAAAVASAAYGGASRDVEVVSPGGTQRVEWTAGTIWLTGAASIVANIEWIERTTGG